MACGNMDFSKLPAIPKIKITKMLSIGSRYNLSLVFPEMEGEVRRSITPFLQFLSKVYFEETIIEDLSNLETTGVLASYGYLEELINSLELKDLDVTNVPSNILSSLTRVVRKRLNIHKVTGFELSMLSNLRCKELMLSFLSIPTSVTQEINVKNCYLLHRISGNLCGLLDSITCDTLHMAEIDDATSDSLSKMLPSRVRELELRNYQDKQLILDLLAKYDGKGRCNAINFYDNASSTEFEENLTLWATANGWRLTVDPDGRKFQIKRLNTLRMKFKRLLIN